MSDLHLLQILPPFAIALAITHLIVLPLKAFFITGDLRDRAVRATTWNLLAVSYTVGVLLLFGVGTGAQSTLWSVIKFLPLFLAFAFSVGIWLYVMVRATKKFMLIDVAVFTILALAAS